MQDKKDEQDDDISIDSESDLDDSVLAEEHAGDTVKKLKDKLKAAEEKAKEYLDSWQRAQADFLNLRKRDEEAKVEFLKFAHSDLLSQLMPVLDSFTLASAHGNKELEVIHKQLMQVLKQNGLEEQNPVGETFDPRLHESVGVVEVEDKKDDHKILEVMQKGYILHGKIIRPAKVKIGSFNQ
jgi:molecular chaperone GrpE